MELDGYCRPLKIAFEHHGEQHYSKNSIYAREAKFLAKRKRDDLLKEKLCKEKGIHLIIIPEIPTRTSLEELKPLIKNQLKACGISIPANFDEIQVDLKETYTTPKFVSQYNLLTEIAKGKGGKCLSKNYKNARTHLKWRCAEGHEWKATADYVKNQGYWCGICDRENRRTV